MDSYEHSRRGINELIEKLLEIKIDLVTLNIQQLTELYFAIVFYGERMEEEALEEAGVIN